MFGADTPLVMDALQIAALAAAGAAGAAYFFARRMKSRTNRGRSEECAPQDGAMDLSKRVEVLERIATDQSIGLSDDIEALRDAGDRAGKGESRAL